MGIVVVSVFIFPIPVFASTSHQLKILTQLQQDNANVTNNHLLQLEERIALLSQQLSLDQQLFQKTLNATK
jgi:hypothetical protein